GQTQPGATIQVFSGFFPCPQICGHGDSAAAPSGKRGKLGPPGPLKVQILFALFFTSLPRVPIPSVIASQSPPARWRFHFRHEGAKAETPIPLWTNQI